MGAYKTRGSSLTPTKKGGGPKFVLDMVKVGGGGAQQALR